jgi:DNA-binding transcriptional regulator PaaX
LKYDDEKVKIQLTNKGKKRIKEYSIDVLKIKKPKRWDKKWRILIFDIPTRPKIYNQAREALRNKIKELGFCQMQKSVWVYPYECEDELLFIAEVFEVQKYIEIITAEKILHAKEIKRKFNLE